MGCSNTSTNSKDKNMQNINKHMIEMGEYIKVTFVINNVQHTVTFNDDEVVSVTSNTGLIPDEYQRMSAITTAKMYLQKSKNTRKYAEKNTELRLQAQRLLTFIEVELECPNTDPDTLDYDNGFTHAFKDIAGKLSSMIKNNS
jgi:hypothetical protein